MQIISMQAQNIFVLLDSANFVLYDVTSKIKKHAWYKKI